ncbi:MAG: CidA/LrgA family protein [Bacillota bacterium]|nr:CidA/LrgA family protein [Bacillota bacterium]
MKNIIKTLTILFTVMWVGGILKSFIPLPIPDMIYAMILLFILLITKIVRPEDIDAASGKLLSIFAFFFIPAGVGLMKSYRIIEHEIFSVLAVLTASFVLTVLAVAFTVKLVRRYFHAE